MVNSANYSSSNFGNFGSSPNIIVTPMVPNSIGKLNNKSDFISLTNVESNTQNIWCMA